MNNYVFKTSRKLDLYNLLFILIIFSVFLSPFYLWSSGLPQISHFVMLFVFIFHFFAGKWFFQRWWFWAACFVFYATAINLIYYAKYLDSHTLFSVLYYVFNFFVLVSIINIAFRVGTKKFLCAIEIILWCQLIFELLLVLIGLGRKYGGIRAMGTFNDPNQFAHWLIWVSLCLGAIGVTLRQSLFSGFISWVFATIGVLFSASRSGILGLMVLGIAYGIVSLMRFIKILCLGNIKLKIFHLIIFMAILILILSGVVDILHYVSKIVNSVSFVIERFHDKSINTTFEGRGYDRLWVFPEYLFLGAGEGANERWGNRVSFTGEIHSTFVGVIFYYGIPGLLFLCVFLYKSWAQLKNIWMKISFFAPLLYSVGTYNLRNWFFWIGLAVLMICANHTKLKI